MNNYEMAIPPVLQQISDILSKMCNQSITLTSIGNPCVGENGKLSIELKEISIPKTIISTPNPVCPQDADGFYKVNRIRLGTTILGDTAAGCPFTDNEIKQLIKGNGIWAYY